MINTLYLPELREMLETGNVEELREFCTALHPARTAEFMEGLDADEAWQVLSHADLETRGQIISYFEPEMQVAILETQDRDEIAELVSELPPDDRVDILSDVRTAVSDEILSRLPADDRRDIMRLRQFPEGTAGAVMTTEVAMLPESLSVAEAMREISRQAADVETIYYLYIVDDEQHLRGVVSARQLVAAMGTPDKTLGELMESDLLTAKIMDDQEDVAHKVARLDLLAIPVVDDENRMMGIITHDDVIDVLHEEATEDAHRIAAVDPLEQSYLKTHLFTLSWKRGFWLTILFFCALLTAVALHQYEDRLTAWTWLVPFIPLVISSGGNSGSQSATLIITALSRGHITLSDWAQVVLRELAMGLVLGGLLGLLGFVFALLVAPRPFDALVIPVTLLLTVVSGTLTGSILPLIFKRLGLDPAMMSNPFVAGIIDIVGIVIYMSVAFAFLNADTPIST